MSDAQVHPRWFVALSLVVGNCYYSWLAYRQGQLEGRDELTALPYGINTISLFAYIFLLQNLESAEAAGDRYPTPPCLGLKFV